MLISTAKRRYFGIPSFLLLILLLLAYLINGLLYMQKQSITFDEMDHLAFGVRILKGNTERTDNELFNSKMPVSALNALPRAFEQLLNRQLKRKDNGAADVISGRYVTLFISLLIGLYVFKWAKELYGEPAGFFSLFLFVFCPNCLAHSVLVTTDTYSVLLLLTVLYYQWKYLSKGDNRDFLLFCALTGLAQLVKQSLFHLYIILPCLFFLHFLSGDRKLNGRQLLKKTCIFLLINILLINAGFYFQGFGRPLDGYHFRSSLFLGLQTHFSFLSGLPLPLPSSFIEGLDMAKYYDNFGGGFFESTYGNITVLGHSSNGGSFWYYYFVICFFKTPIPILIFLAWSCWLLVRRGSGRSFIRNELFLLFPVLYFFVLMNFFYKSQTNIRQIIFIYPLLYIFCGSLFQYIRTPGQKWILAVLSLAYTISVLAYFRNYIPYTNEFIADKKMAYRVVGAANLEFGQGLYFLEEYLRAHPGLQPVSPLPRSGLQYIEVNDLLDVWNQHRYDWIQSFRPVGHIAHVYLIFDIKTNQLKQQ